MSWMLRGLVVLLLANSVQGQDIPGKSLTEMEKATTLHAHQWTLATVAVRSAKHPGVGSGVIVEATGLVLTAGHCVREPGSEMEIVLSSGRVVPAKALGAEWDADIGMVQITAPGPWPYVEMAKADTPTKGEWCVALGHPGGYQAGRQPVLRLGHVLEASRKVMTFGMEQSATDCRLMPGDSGGPLMDLSGRLIGIHCIASYANTTQNGVAKGGQGAGHATMKSYRDQWDFLRAGKSSGVNKALAQEGLLKPGKAPSLPKKEAKDEVKKDPKAEGITIEFLQKKWQLEDGLLGTLETLKKQLPAAAFDDILKQVDDQYTTAMGKPESLRLKVTSAGPGALQGLGTPKTNPRKTYEKSVKEPLAKLAQPMKNSIVELLNGKTRTGFATVVGPNRLVAKLSELPQEITCLFEKTTVPGKLLASWPEQDLALLEVNIPGLQPVTWAEYTEPGSVLVTQTANGPELGILAEPARRIMSVETQLKEGFLGVKDRTEMKRRQEKTDVINKLFGANPNTRRDGFAAAFTHDLDLRADETGLPLVNLQGQVVGINIAREGLATNFAIPAKIVQNLVGLAEGK
jgi:S1-C subfamily serine protease